MRPSITRAVVASFVLIPLGLAGCGSDEPAAEPATSTADVTATTELLVSKEVKPFCDAHLAFARGVSGPQSDEVDIEALAAELSTTAPAEIADTVATFLEVAGRAASTGDDALFVSDEFRDPASEMERYVAQNCGHHVVEVSATEYGFDGVPASMASGPTVFHFVNDGEEIHEGLLFRRAEGVDGDPIELLTADPSGSSGDLEEVGVAFVGEAGDESYLTTDLEPGAYVLACFFPQGAETLDDIPTDSGTEDATTDHRSAGMVVAFDVEA